MLAVLLLALPAGAQAPYLVKDINTTVSSARASSEPSLFTAHGGRVYFVATTHETGTELWSTDGAGASMVADILPGEASGNPAALRAGIPNLLFNARDVNHGVELWTTDGTGAGTRMLVDINPGPSSSDASTGILHRDRILFAADNGTNGRELWSTDGTEGGTRMVKDLAAGAPSSSPRNFVTLGNDVYFLAAGGLWKTDGTEAGTVSVVTNILARNVTATSSRIFFEGYSPETNWELWVSDGTAAGTFMLPEIRPGTDAAFESMFSSSGFSVFGNRVFFLANDAVHGRELWVSDGTAAGTRLLVDMTAGAAGVFNGLNIVTVGNRGYFSGHDAEHGIELWSTDGTAAGTSMFVDTAPGEVSSGAFPVAANEGKLFFLAYAGNVAGLWVTDGSVNGTRRLTANGSPFEFYSNARSLGGRVYFGGVTPLTGTEPWVSDGTDAGTHMIANLAQDGAPSSSPREFAATGNLLFFHATENLYDGSLWRTDGTANGTFKLMESGQYSSELITAGTHLFFTHPELHGWAISDGTVEGTVSTDVFRRRFGSASIYALHPFEDALFVSVGDSYDWTLWKTTDAPHAPATLLGAHRPYGLTEVAGRYFFYAEAPSSIHERGLWVTDGTAEGTYAAVPDLGADYSGVSEMASAQGLAFFVLAQRDQPAALWQSDGTLDGTVPVKVMASGSSRTDLVSTGHRLFLLTNDALWTSDGTEAGTLEIAKVKLLSLGDDSMQTVGDRVVFRQYDRDTNIATLWGSDGTAAGTKMLAQLVYTTFARIDGVVYFAGTDDAHGTEVWTTDGTPEGTKMLLDLNPGPASSSPYEFTAMGGNLYFTAYTQSTGAELWALPLTTARASVRDTHAGESAQTVRFTVSLSRAAQNNVTVSYATSNGTAHAGEDYEAASGTLTFATGETTKTIEVHLLDDTAPENNETFFLTLSNAGSATALIEDDDASADLAASIVFSGSSSGLASGVSIANHGPRGATEVKVSYSSIPTPSQDCWTCEIPQIASGETAAAYGPGSSGFQQTWRSATVHARQSDPDTTNNTVSWTVSAFEDLMMDAAFLTPGATANAAAEIKTYGPPVTPSSSDASVVSISSPVTSADSIATFTVTAHKPGTATLTVGSMHSNLVLTVVPAGTTPRWPNGLRFDTDFTARYVQEPVMLTITPAASAPINGATATGVVVVTANGQELARRTITGKTPVEVPLYFRWLGSVNYQIVYEGDANFLPQTVNDSVFVRSGTPAITGTLQRHPDQPNAYLLKVRVSGAPGAAPTGSVQVYVNGAPAGALGLTPSADGTSTAERTIANVTTEDVYATIDYDGDSLYLPKSQEIRLVAPRRRNVRH
ncbi:MAG TPA: ELWxxDGT repeat protein [Thermoanaerobaculia bacterium]